MRAYYDLHIHSCLSPCGDDGMTPNNIVNMALLLGYNVIALTDHNSVKNCRATAEIAEKNGLCFIPGMELCTSEEVHAVCLFEDIESAERFGGYVYENMPKIKNKSEIYGSQLILNSEDETTGEEESLLLVASGISIEALPVVVKSFGGVCFPAHIDRDSYSILSSLGAFPPEAEFTAAEISFKGDEQALREKYAELRGMLVLRNSDSHRLESMRDPEFCIELNELKPTAVLNAIRGIK